MMATTFSSIFQLVLLSYESFLITCSNVNTLNILFRISSTQKVIDFLFYVNLKRLFELNSNLKFLPNREQRSYLPRLFLACAFRWTTNSFSLVLELITLKRACDDNPELQLEMTNTKPRGLTESLQSLSRIASPVRKISDLSAIQNKERKPSDKPKGPVLIRRGAGDAVEELNWLKGNSSTAGAVMLQDIWIDDVLNGCWKQEFLDMADSSVLIYQFAIL